MLLATNEFQHIFLFNFDALYFQLVFDYLLVNAVVFSIETLFGTLLDCFTAHFDKQSFFLVCITKSKHLVNSWAVRDNFIVTLVVKLDHYVRGIGTF